MVKASEHLESTTEEFLAELTAAAYGVALKHGLRGSFLDVELDLWRELRGVLHRELFRAGTPRRKENQHTEAVSCRR
jgi:hypothetical protein